MVGGAILAGVKKIDVEISSVGHVAVIFTSLNAHFSNEDWQLFMSSEDSLKVSNAYMGRVTTDRRTGAHLVRYVPYQMKSHSLKKKEGNDELITVSIKNYNEDSVKWRPHSAYSGYTIYTTLFGYYPWAVPKGNVITTEQIDQGRSYTEKIFPPATHYVYKFGQTESFCGLVSTIPEFKLFGQNCVVDTKNTENGTQHALTFSKEMYSPSLIKTEAEWYGRVIQSNAAMESYWLLAAPKYCPISNVLRIPKSGVTISYTSLGNLEIVDQDEYVTLPESSSDRQELDQTLVGEDFGSYHVHEARLQVYDVEVEDEDGEEDDEEEESEDEDDSEVMVGVLASLPPRAPRRKPDSRQMAEASKTSSSTTTLSTPQVRQVVVKERTKVPRVTTSAPDLVVTSKESTSVGIENM